MSLSDDGKIVAIGSRNNNSGGPESGHVRVYEYNDISWVQVGNDIAGESSGDYSGDTVSLSSNGKIVAIGSRDNDGNGNNSGHVRVYEYKEYTLDVSGNYHYSTREQGSTNTKPLIVTEGINTAPVVGNSYWTQIGSCLLYTSPSPRDATLSRMPSSA